MGNTRIEAEIEEARLKEREALMQEVQAMKQQAQQELEHEKATYNQKLTSLECELVRDIKGLMAWYKILPYRNNMKQSQRNRLKPAKWPLAR